jgi:hypothetical protein
MVGAGDGLFVAFASVRSGRHDHLHRLDLTTGIFTSLGVFDGSISQISAPPDGTWLAIELHDPTLNREAPSLLFTADAATGDELHGPTLDAEAPGLLCTIDAATGVEISRTQIGRYCSFGVSPGGLILVAEERLFRIWSAPQLHELGTVARSGYSRMTAFHPTRPLAITFSGSHVQVIDLAERTIARSEVWSEAPTDHAVLADGGRLLVGVLGTPEMPDDLADAAIGVWQLPDEFWNASENCDAKGRTIDLREPVVARIAGTGAVIARPASTTLVEFQEGREIPPRAYVGSMLSGAAHTLEIDGVKLLLWSRGEIEVMDLQQRRVARRLRSETDSILDIASIGEGRLVRVLWRPEAPVFSSSPSRSLHDECVMAELLATGAEIVQLESATEERTIAPFPWPSTPDYAPQVGTSVLDLDSAEWSRFAVLPDEGTHSHGLYPYLPPYRWDLLPGGDFMMLSWDESHVDILQTSTGEVVLKLGYFCRPLATLDGPRVLYCDDDGATWIADVRTGERRACGLDVGLYADFNPLILALSPDYTLAAWTTGDAILVSELASGREVARFPMHGWASTIEFADERTIRASGIGGGDWLLVLEGV